jgi:hypothetical protein
MSIAPLTETRFDRSMTAPGLADGALQQPACPSVWRDLSRDWCLWSDGERVAAIVLLTALAIMPAFLLVAGYVLVMA